ncbi:MAG: hypothetical protein ACE14L_05595 [Terriglobales bacterium]
MSRVIAVVLLFGGMLPAQAPARPDANHLVALFGPAFKHLPEFPILLGDLDSDGAEDAVLVATGENPLFDEAQYHYKVIDPYNAYFGFADPKVTSQFAIPTGDKPRMILLVHDWRAPKLRFVVVNLPFDKLSLARVLVKKKVLPAIRAEELSGMKSAIYWNGKKWKWQEQGVE